VVGRARPHRRVSAAPHHSRFCWHARGQDILLTGTPDGVLTHSDRSLTIVDYKVARLTNLQDALYGQYEAQLEGYATIAERIGFGSVAGLALVYTEPMTAPEDAATRGTNDGFDMGFTARIVPVRRRPGLIDGLLRKVRALCDLPELPPTRPDCEDCHRVAALVAAVTETGRAVARGRGCRRHRPPPQSRGTDLS
jgi:hypothetical protein